VIAIFPFAIHAANFRRQRFIVRCSKRFSLAVARGSPMSRKSCQSQGILLSLQAWTRLSHDVRWK